MTAMKMAEIRALDDGDVALQVEKHRRELFDLECKQTTETLDNPNRINDLKRSIARLLTEQRRRELAREHRA